MKKKLEKYTFSKQEIRILREIASGKHSLISLRRTLSIKPNLLSYYIRKLIDKKIIEFKRKRADHSEREYRKAKKYIYFCDLRHALLLKELLLTYHHISWEKILSNLGIVFLFEVVDTDMPDISFKNISKTTFWRYLRNFMALGIIELDGSTFRINPRFSILKDFLEEYQRFIVTTIVREISENAVILWQKDMECLVRLPKDVKITKKGFFKTATSCFHNFGIQLVSDFDIYFYSRKKDNIRTEDIILHTLLIEKDNVRYVTYSLLLLKKELKKIDRKYLLKEAARLNLGLQINAMLQFLETKGVRRGLAFPTWSEFVTKAKEYGVV